MAKSVVKPPKEMIKGASYTHNINFVRYGKLPVEEKEEEQQKPKEE